MKAKFAVQKLCQVAKGRLRLTKTSREEDTNDAIESQIIPESSSSIAKALLKKVKKKPKIKKEPVFTRQQLKIREIKEAERNERRKEGRFELIHMDEFIDNLLRKEHYLNIKLPQIPVSF
uniref:Pre-mRNA-splicing factor 38 n=1 Tax=Panagrolaimus sp. ES5 TaxID=591445 RepID=A0AC34GDV0_9BILA